MPKYNVRKKFGKRLRFLRKEAQLSQEELGFKADIHRTYIGSVERRELSEQSEEKFRRGSAKAE